MPVTIACTSCSARFNVNETTIGKKVKCPKCQAVFQAAPADSFAGGAPRQAPAAPAGYQQGAPPQPNYGAPPMHQGYGAPPPPMHVGGGNWSTARTGLMLTLVALIGTAVIYFVLGAYILASPSGLAGGGNPMAFAQTGGAFALIAVCAGAIFAILWFVGICLCIASPYAPAKSRAKVVMFCVIGMVVAFLIMFVINMIFVSSAVNQGFDMAQQRQFNPNNPPDFQAMQRNMDRAANTGMGIIITAFVFYGIMGILGLVALIFWMMYFMAIADHFRSSGLRVQAVFTLIFAILAGPLFWGIMFLLAQMGMGPAAAVRIIGILIIVIFGGLFTQYSMTTAKAMGVIKRGSGGM